MLGIRLAYRICDRCKNALKERTDAAVTKIVIIRQEWSRLMWKTLGINLVSWLSLSAFAGPVQYGYGAAKPSNELYVQVPALNAAQPMYYQPVVGPTADSDLSGNQIGHLWPRSISYSMETDSVEAYLQPNLSVGMQYNYSFYFELGARTDEGKTLAVPDGWYQLQVAVIKKSGNGLKGKAITNPYDRYVTSHSQFLRVTNGSFGRKISLRFSDVTTTAMKHHLFVELIPLLDDCGEAGRCIQLNSKGEPDPQKSILKPNPHFKTYLAEMPFIPFQPAGGKSRDANDLRAEDLAFLEGSLAKYIFKAQNIRTRTQLASREVMTPSLHAAQNRLSLMDAADPSFTPSVKALLGQLLNDNNYGPIKISAEQKPLLTALCLQIITHNASFQERTKNQAFQPLRNDTLASQARWCADRPEMYLRLNRIIHVGKAVPGKVERIAQRGLNYTLMANYMSGRTKSMDAITSVTIKPPSFISSVLDQIGLSVGQTASYLSGRSVSQTGIGSSSVGLDFNYVIFDIPTYGSQQCLEVRTLDNMYTRDFFYDRRPEAKNGIYICGPKLEALKVPEIYTHVFERCKDTTMMECDALSQSINLVRRGEAEISGFFYAIRDGISPDHNNRVVPFGTYENAEKYFGNTPIAKAMEIVTPIEFATEPIPSFLQKITGQYSEDFN